MQAVGLIDEIVKTPPKDNQPGRFPSHYPNRDFELSTLQENALLNTTMSPQLNVYHSGAPAGL